MAQLIKIRALNEIRLTADSTDKNGNITKGVTLKKDDEAEVDRDTAESLVSQGAAIVPTALEVAAEAKRDADKAKS